MIEIRSTENSKRLLANVVGFSLLDASLGPSPAPSSINQSSPISRAPPQPIHFVRGRMCLSCNSRRIAPPTRKSQMAGNLTSMGTSMGGFSTWRLHASLVISSGTSLESCVLCMQSACVKFAVLSGHTNTSNHRRTHPSHPQKGGVVVYRWLRLLLCCIHTYQVHAM